ncbi:alpha/beta hydrolase [Streptomyces fuscichromogenes]|uniref:alpha/beta hydrolase n=1 Tax=Streptomyces fuscichromogenes TaxID=1324013 RepID=UPI0016708918|nr:alpha/beta hydrolase fold domain-containing protein [Streptomyces fuscichromogenes]
MEERQVPGPEGGPDVTLLILSPAEDRGPKAGIFHVHGGPFLLDGSAVVVSVEYRLAPEHPGPAPVEDCYAGLVWTAKNAPELGIDREHLLVSGYQRRRRSCGGPRALLARDRAFPKLSHQVLSCPMLDDRFETYSSRMLDREGLWDRNSNLHAAGTPCWASVVAAPTCHRTRRQAAPRTLADLPRTYIDTSSVEVFRDDILAYARRLSEVGVSVDLHMWSSGFHGFDGLAPQAAVSRASIATREEFIRRAIEG